MAEQETETSVLSEAEAPASIDPPESAVGVPTAESVDTNENEEAAEEEETIPLLSDMEVRTGTISSARFNILSTMVGGGVLSLPLAFELSGNGGLGPVILFVTALITDFCFRLLVATSIRISQVDPQTRGKNTFETITEVAFGPAAFIFSKCLVVSMCFFGAVGYCVLLRDMLEPFNDEIGLWGSHVWLHKNLLLFTVVLGATPLCTLQTFTALKNLNAASMSSVVILMSIVVLRSLQCAFSQETFYAVDKMHWMDSIQLWPRSMVQVLDALPLFISCFVCHYNILPVHNELANPTPKRVSWWLRSTTWYAFGLYTLVGFCGSLYAPCTATGHVHGNILLDFHEDDKLLLVGRSCLAITITLAFPMLVIPARNIIIESMSQSNASSDSSMDDVALEDARDSLEEPLLSPEDGNEEEEHQKPPSLMLRLGISIGVFWTAGGLASCVNDISIVWDLLGSSLSVLLSFLIPAGCYLQVTKEDGPTLSRIACYGLIAFFLPFMLVSTANAVRNTFFG